MKSYSCSDISTALIKANSPLKLQDFKASSESQEKLEIRRAEEESKTKLRIKENIENNENTENKVNKKDKEHEKFTFEDYANSYKLLSLQALKDHLKNTNTTIQQHEKAITNSTSQLFRTNNLESIKFQTEIKSLVEAEIKNREINEESSLKEYISFKR
jgi:hypothetical protein